MPVIPDHTFVAGACECGVAFGMTGYGCQPPLPLIADIRNRDGYACASAVFF